MKIALVIERFDPARGGRERSTAQTATALARRGHEVTVFCQSCQDACEDVRVLPLKVLGLDRSTRLASFARSVRGAAREGGYDIVHATMPVPGANVFQPRGGLVGAQMAAALRRRTGAWKVAAALAQPLDSLRWRMRRYERRLVTDPGVLCLAVSEMVAREFMNFYARGEGVRVIYNAVEVPDVTPEQRRTWRDECRRRIEVPPGGPVFLTVAKNFVLKGLAEAIEAFARWYHSPACVPGARLVAVGGRRFGPFRGLARKRRVAKQVVFVEPTGDIFPWYAAADAVVLLSWYDPCSRVVLEAARWGIPSITTVYNGAAEALARGAGIVVGSPRDTAAVVGALTELADPDRRAERVEACRDAAAGLGMDRHVDELLDAYAEVIARRG
ncbi:MAG TPA: glycosyltransferase family 4 protein [Phycisphaerae bacterium]|nr:glycosyltransferase family 4 protein [Phycisphaerae bacterium]